MVLFLASDRYQVNVSCESKGRVLQENSRCFRPQKLFLVPWKLGWLRSFVLQFSDKRALLESFQTLSMAHFQLRGMLWGRLGHQVQIHWLKKVNKKEQEETQATFSKVWAWNGKNEAILKQHFERQQGKASLWSGGCSVRSAWFPDFHICCTAMVSKRRRSLSLWRTFTLQTNKRVEVQFFFWTEWFCTCLRWSMVCLSQTSVCPVERSIIARTAFSCCEAIGSHQLFSDFPSVVGHSPEIFRC